MIDKHFLRHLLATRDEEVWRSDEDGRHFRIETETGEITAGFGGKLNGQKIKPKVQPKGKRIEEFAEGKRLSETKEFKDIAEKARKYSDSRDFSKSLTDNEWELIQSQRIKTGTEESEIDYFLRMYRMFNLTDADLPSQSKKVVQGKNILTTWKRQPNKFDYEIDDVIHTQGFDGVPKVVSKAEFDKAVKAANGGKGFIAQRAYAAPNQETLDYYRDMLYHGEWYVNCETGGAQYGQGMYCAADYTGQLTDGIEAEMKHYRESNEDKQNVPDVDWRDIDKERDQRYDDIINDLYYKYDYSPYEDYPEDSIQYKLHAESDRILDMSLDDYAKEFHPELFTARSYVETFTLTPDAKIISHADLSKLKRENLLLEGEVNRYFEEHNLTEDEKDIVRKELSIGTFEQRKRGSELKKSNPELYAEISRKYGDDLVKLDDDCAEKQYEISRMDDGVFAALLGYDAINAEGHGKSGSYTVILNRTKCIFLEPENKK